MNNHDEQRNHRDRQAVVLCWTSACAGLLLPIIAMMLAGRRTPVQTILEFWRSFTGAEPGLALAVALNAAPFWIYSVFALLHLGRIPDNETLHGARRLTGAIGALALMVGASLWINTAIFSSRSSTAAIGFIFLPAYVVGAAFIGYAIGRAQARVRSRHSDS